MANITLLPSAKVPLIYDGELTMTTEWYRFFWNIYGFTGAGVIPVDKGGTGLTTIGDHQVIIGNANNVFEPAIFTGSGINITYSPGVINLAIGASGVTPGTYGLASQVGVFTVNQYGSITAAANTSIGIDASQIVSGTIASARIAGAYTGITGVGTLTVGTWNADTIGTSYGGTGLTNFTSGGALYATSTSALTSGTLPVTAGGTGQTSFTNGQLLIGNTTGNTLTKATLTAGSGVTITNGAGSITISATGSGGTITAVTGVAPISSSGGTTPAISISQSNTTTDGYLSATDWNTFNNKQPAGAYLTAVTADAPLSGAGTSASHLVISQANTTTNGYLSSTDWNTFNSKQPAGTYVTSISIASSNGFTGTSSGGATPSLTLATSITGILKGNGTAISAATSGTDYAPATSGTSILYGNGAGGFSNVTIGTGVSFVGGTLSATGSGGTVTSVSGTGTVNGITLTGTVTSSGSLTLGGTLSGIGNSQLTNSTISGVALGGNLFNLTAGTGVSFSAGTTYNGSTAITINATGTGGTVTSVAALTLGTAGTDLSSTVANSTTTPVITLNVPTASAANRGALSAADWSTFNGKQAALVSGTNIKTVGGNTLLGSGDVGTINVGYGGTGLTSVTAGYIPFGSTATALSTDITLFWNNTNKVLGVGTATPFSYASRLAVVGGGNTAAFIGGGATNIGSISTGRSAIDLTIGTAGSTNQFFTGVASGDSIVAFGSGKLWFGSGNYNAGGSPFAIIHASGGVSIGNTTDPGAANLSVSNYALIGTTAPISASATSGTGYQITQYGSVVQTITTNYEGISLNYPTYTSGTTYPVVFRAAGGVVGYINYNGSVVGYVTSSDQRLKTNIVSSPSALPVLDKIKVRQFNWLANDALEEYGFIAQELKEAYAGAAFEGKDKEDGSMDTPWGIDTSKLVPLLVKSIQELKQQFDAYVASHP